MLPINKAHHQGFTLLETMAACALGIILCGVIMQNYLSNKRIYQQYQSIIRLHNNLQLADFFLRQAVQHAGFAGCRTTAELAITNHTKVNFDLLNPVKSYTTNNSDVLVITKANTAITNINNNITQTANNIAVVKNPATEGNPLVLLADCQHADLFSIDNYYNQHTIRLTHPLAHNYLTKATTISRFETMTFFIAKTTRLNHDNQPIYSLFLAINHTNKEELIPAITNLQIHYEINHNTEVNLTTQQITDLNLWQQITALTIILTPQEPELGITTWPIYLKLQQKN